MLRLAGKTIPAIDLPIIKFDYSEDSYDILEAQSLSRLFKPKTLFLGIPGAFVPSVLLKYLPEYLRYMKEMRALSGITQTLVMSVNDPYVLQSFAEELDAEENMIFLSD